MLDPDNLDSRDASNVWMPFHFFPDNSGICRPNSENVKALVQFIKNRFAKSNLSETEKNIYMGILLHILVDTHTHEGFMGLYCRHNDISHLDDETERDFTFFSNAAPAIGHGEAMTYPDDSWRIWSYKDSRDQIIKRDNPKAFLNAVKQIAKTLSIMGVDNPGIEAGLEKKYDEIFRQKKDHASAYDQISLGNGGSEEGITYKSWKEKTLRPVQSQENIYLKNDASPLEDSEWYLFQQAAKTIRTFFKDEIFPQLTIQTKVY
jgi:hypothetical protein